MDGDGEDEVDTGDHGEDTGGAEDQGGEAMGGWGEPEAPVYSNRGKFQSQENPLQLKLMEAKRAAEAKAAEAARKAKVAAKAAMFGGSAAAAKAPTKPVNTESELRKKSSVPGMVKAEIDGKIKEMMSSGIVQNKTRGVALLSSRGGGRVAVRTRGKAGGSMGASASSAEVSVHVEQNDNKGTQ
jgi:hypothetical protein